MSSLVPNFTHPALTCGVLVVFLRNLQMLEDLCFLAAMLMIKSKGFSNCWGLPVKTPGLVWQVFQSTNHFPSTTQVLHSHKWVKIINIFSLILFFRKGCSKAVVKRKRYASKIVNLQPSWKNVCCRFNGTHLFFWSQSLNKEWIIHKFFINCNYFVKRAKKVKHSNRIM